MEIERKFLIKKLPEDIDSYPHELIRQAYISTDPVIRIRRKGESFILTVKSSGLMAREETELSISEKSFDQLMTKTEGLVIEKVRYKIPERDQLTIELDVFQGVYAGFIMAEVEFEDISQARAYLPPAWFGREVTEDTDFHNSTLSRRTPQDIVLFFEKIERLTQS
ncbi:MAG: CYTH domain-containing protein [Eubacterium sp.]|nr:CYTH domain-containing protein [Eubacterium sp.]